MAVWMVLATFSGLLILFGMVGYPVLLLVLDRMFKPAKHMKAVGYEPTVSYLIVAHNEEEVIQKKLENALRLDYPESKLQIVVASDNSTDGTNRIVELFINEHPEMNILLHKTRERKGKTNAQNEAQKLTIGEILVMTDANAEVEPNAIRELVSFFTADDIAYVCGQLRYRNAQDRGTGQAESTYWDLDLKMRDIESRLQTITAGNGALYACRNREYVDFNPVMSHDSAMPYHYAKNLKRALFNPDAIAYEKTGQKNEDEFKRKIRMNRIILSAILQGIKVSNFFKYRWFSLFYFGHRVCRYSLWLAHFVLLLSSFLGTLLGNTVMLSMLLAQLAWIIITALTYRWPVRKRFVRMLGYYGMTIAAQFAGVYRILRGQSKPFWEKVESTR